jgi:hypothetical protein
MSSESKDMLEAPSFANVLENLPNNDGFFSVGLATVSNMPVMSGTK